MVEVGHGYLATMWRPNRPPGGAIRVQKVLFLSCLWADLAYTLVAYAILATNSKSELKFDLWGRVEAVVASEVTKRPSKWVQNKVVSTSWLFDYLNIESFNSTSCSCNFVVDSWTSWISWIFTWKLHILLSDNMLEDFFILYPHFKCEDMVFNEQNTFCNVNKRQLYMFVLVSIPFL